MPCFYPVTAWKSREKNPHSGKSYMAHNTIQVGRLSRSKNISFDEIQRPCGNCIGCRRKKSGEWAARCYHEASLFKQNTFITLTLDDLHLPDDLSLDHRMWQLFMKRLRKKFTGFEPVTNPKTGEITYPIRNYMCGEYGEKLGRPHYHAAIFNFDFPDKIPWRKTKQGHQTYISPILKELWPYGYHEIGDVTFESAAYIARYIMQKINGKPAADHYSWVDANGQIINRKPEYNKMSLKPGIARNWFEKFKNDVYPSDEVIIRGRKYAPPKYYDKLYEISQPEHMEEIKWKRELSAKKHLDDNTKARLAVKEQVAQSRLNNLPRTLK